MFPVFSQEAEKSGDDSASEEGEGSGEESGDGGGPGLGEILGLMFVVCCVLYCIGIGYKIVKIIKGTYVEEEPVFLKYK